MSTAEQLISASDPLGFHEGEYDGYLTVTVVTNERSIKLIYSPQDTRDKLDLLLEESDVNGSVKNAVLGSIGFTTAYKEHSTPSSYASDLPGITLIVKHPVTGKSGQLYNVIMSLNDQYKWTREKVADWIEEACDTKDISFKVPEELKNETGELSKLTQVVKIQRVLAG